MTGFISHVATIEIPVTDLSKAIEFYTEVIGVKVETHGEDFAMLTFEKIGVPTLFLVKTDDSMRLSFKNTQTGIEHKRHRFLHS